MSRLPLRVVVAAAASIALAAHAQAQQSETQETEDAYLRYCALCHGLGVGPGPLADSLKKPAPDLTEIARRNGGVYPAEKVAAAIRDGGIGGHGTMRLLAWSQYFGQEMGQERAEQLVTDLTEYLRDRQAR